jgi:hypothetical protein
MHELNFAIASSKCQPILPWSIPEALGLNVSSILDLKTLPFALVVFVSDKGARVLVATILNTSSKTSNPFFSSGQDEKASCNFQ